LQVVPRRAATGFALSCSTWLLNVQSINKQLSGVSGRTVPE
jgi:hypothetical protein